MLSRHLFIYIAIEIFRAKDSKIPNMTKFATVIIIAWFSGLFGLLISNSGETGGGYVGDLINSGMLALVNSGVAAFIYILLIIITLLFIMRLSFVDCDEGAVASNQARCDGNRCKRQSNEKCSRN